MATAAELISAAEAATTAQELDDIEAQAEGRVTVIQAVESARERLAGETEGIVHLAGEVTLPALEASAEWDVLEDFPTFTFGQWAYVDGIGTVQIMGVNESAQGRLTVTNHGSEGNQPPGTVIYGGTAITLVEAPSGAEPPAPDYVWVGCSTCWTPQDVSRPVRAYAEWQSDGFRFRTYNCQTCSSRQGGNIEVHPSVYGFWMEDARLIRQGEPAALSSEVATYAAG